jgi:Ca2+:H+ antiporter
MIMTYYSYICSRIYLHHPPGEEKRALNYLDTTPEDLREKERQLQAANPSANQYVVLGMLVIVIGIMAATAEWVGHIRECMTNDSPSKLSDSWSNPSNSPGSTRTSK